MGSLSPSLGIYALNPCAVNFESFYFHATATATHLCCFIALLCSAMEFLADDPVEAEGQRIERGSSTERASTLR